MKSGAYWTGSWWGGRLADGSEIVINPDHPPQALFDLTKGNDGPVTPYQPTPNNARDWLRGRNGALSLWVKRLSDRNPSRGVLAIATLGLIVGAGALVAAVTFLMPGMFTKSPVVVIFTALIVGIAVAAIPISADHARQRRIAFAISPDDDDQFAAIRYVPAAITAHPEWRAAAALADTIGPDNASAPRVLNILWATAGIPTSALDGALTGTDGDLLTSVHRDLKRLLGDSDTVTSD